MERFREQEKVFKMKEYSIKGLQQSKGRHTEDEESEEEGSKEEENREEIQAEF